MRRAALDTYEVAYSYYGGSRVAIDSARGFYLSDFLRFAGVDLNSVAALDFYTQDHTAGAYRTFTRYSMLDAPRYYFPNLGIDADTGEVAPRNGGSVWDGATQVETMLALEDNWEWDGEAVNFENMSDSSCFRLVFGQLDPYETLTSSSAKYVHAVYVTFSGIPILTTEEPQMSVVVGSDYRVTVNVAAEDSLLDEYVRENLLWSSNNSAIIDVDMYGNLRVLGDGETEITASFGAVSVSVVVSTDRGGTTAVVGESDGSGDANNGAGGAPPSDEHSPAVPETLEPPSADAKPQDGADAVAFTLHNAGVYILSSELMAQTQYVEWVNSVINHEVTTDSATGGVANWREGAMDDGAEALRIQKPRLSTAVVATAASALLAIGFAGELASFTVRKKWKTEEKGNG